MPVGIGIGLSMTLLKPVTASGSSTTGQAIGFLLVLTKAS